MATLRIFPGGKVKAIYEDGLDTAGLGLPPPVRASHVEPISSGPYAGWWMVDMSPLGLQENRPDFMVCLWPPFPPSCRGKALAAEKAFLEAAWLNQP